MHLTFYCFGSKSKTINQRIYCQILHCWSVFISRSFFRGHFTTGNDKNSSLKLFFLFSWTRKKRIALWTFALYCGDLKNFVDNSLIFLYIQEDFKRYRKRFINFSFLLMFKGKLITDNRLSNGFEHQICHVFVELIAVLIKSLSLIENCYHTLNTKGVAVNNLYN